MSVTLICQWCDKEFEAQRSTAKFCCDAHKMNFARKEKIDKLLTDKDLPATVQASKLPIPEPKAEPKLVVEPTIEATSHQPTLGSPGWYVHGTQDDPNKTWDKVCVRCGKSFSTSLELMRFCSQECKKEVMVVVADGPHKKFVEWLKR